MPAVARLGDALSCNSANKISTGSGSVFVNNIAIARIGDETPSHPGGSQSTMKTGNGNNVYANNISVCVVGSIDNAHGGGTHANAEVVEGSNNVFIG